MLTLTDSRPRGHRARFSFHTSHTGEARELFSVFIFVGATSKLILTFYLRLENVFGVILVRPLVERPENEGLEVVAHLAEAGREAEVAAQPPRRIGDV